MPPRSTIYQLPAPTREELDRRLVHSGYGNYKEHLAWLQAEGHQVSLDALKRYGVHTRKTLDAQEAARREKADVERAKIKAITEGSVELLKAAGNDLAAYYQAETLKAQVFLQEGLYREGVTPKDMEIYTRALKNAAQTHKLLSDLTPQTAGKNDKDRAREAEKRGVTPEVILAIRDRIENGIPTDAPDADKEDG